MLDWFLAESLSFVEQNAVFIEDVVYVPLFDFMEVFSVELIDSCRFISVMSDVSIFGAGSALCFGYIFYRTLLFHKKMKKREKLKDIDTPSSN